MAKKALAKVGYALLSYALGAMAAGLVIQADLNDGADQLTFHAIIVMEKALNPLTIPPPASKLLSIGEHHDSSHHRPLAH